MDKRWLNLFFGQVEIKVTGNHVESFINHCLQNGVDMSNIKRVSEDSIVCTIRSEHVRQLRSLLRKSDAKFRVLDRRGMPFYLRKLSFKKGFVAGIVLFAAVLFVLSNMLWDVNVVGAGPKVEHEIRQVLNDVGVQNGKFHSSLPSAEDIQYAINDRVDKVAWVGASLDGTTYNFRVVEKEVPKEKKGLTPRNLVATKEAVVHDIYVEQGKAKVKPNDYVQKGDVLISGKIGDKDHRKIIPAKGKIFGETWYETTVSVPLSSKLKTYTGERTTKHAIEIFGVRIPYWGFYNSEYKQYDVKTKKTPVHFLGWELPIVFERKSYLQTEESKQSYTKKQAVEVAKQLGQKDLKAKLGKSDQIKSGKILRQSLENGKVKVLLYYTVIENIAAEKPLVKNKETE